MKNINIDFNRYEKAILEMRKRPEYADLVKWAYFDEDIVKAAVRFSKSYEAAQIIWQIDKLLGVKNSRERRNFRVVDVGGGRGIVSYVFSLLGYQTTLLDINESNICGTGAAKELFEKSKMDIKIIKADIERYKEKNGQYDVVFCRQVLHHASDLHQMVAMMANLIKPGGWLHAFKEHVIRIKKDLPVFLKNHPSREFNVYENAFTRSVYLDTLKKAGLKNIRCWIAGYAPEPRDFQSMIEGENVPAHIPPKGLIALLKRKIRFYWFPPGTEFSFIGRKPYSKYEGIF